MPELPDVTVYVEAMRERIVGHRLESVAIRGPFLLRSIDPPISEFSGKKAVEVRRIGKRIAIGFEGDLWLVLHLMIAGRLHWKPSKAALASFVFDNGALTLTEAGTQHRANLYTARGADSLAQFSAGGIEIFEADLDSFRQALQRENHTLKRALTDPRLFSGIGNAYSDEILHRARLSPVLLTQRMNAGEVAVLFQATRDVLEEWTQRLRDDAAGKFPEKVTAFREGMAVHGRFKQPCPRCGKKVQRIRYASNETNYCPECQTGGKLLADRALSRLLGADWVKAVED